MLNDNLTEKLQDLVSRKDFTLGIGRVGPTNGNGNGNGNASGMTIDTSMLGEQKPIQEEPEQHEGEEEFSPRVDKGKGRAAPEPEVIEPILSPSLLSHGGEHADSDSDGELAAGGGDNEHGEESERPRVLTMGGMDAVRSLEEGGLRIGLPSPTERYVLSLSLVLSLIFFADRGCGSRKRERYFGRDKFYLDLRNLRANMRVSN